MGTERPALYPTKTRIAFLSEVDMGEVFQRPNGESTTDTLGRETRVTSKCAEAEQAGWIHLVPLRFGARRWDLTAAGRLILDASKEC